MGLDDLKQQALDLQAEIEAAAERIDVDSAVQRKLRLESRPSLLPNERHKLAELTAIVTPWLTLQKAVDDLLRLIDTADETMSPTISSDLNELTERLATLQQTLKKAPRSLF